MNKTKVYRLKSSNIQKIKLVLKILYNRKVEWILQALLEISNVEKKIASIV